MKYLKFIISLVIGVSVIFLNGADFASAGWVEGKHGSAMEFDGNSTFVGGISALGNVKTVCFWVKANSTTEKIMEMRNDDGVYIEVSAGTIAATGFTSPTIYVDGIVGSTIDTDWRHVAITTDTNVDASAAVIGKTTVAAADTFFTGVLDDVKIYSYARSADEIRLDYNAGLATHLGPSGKSCADDPASCMDYGLVGSWNMDEGTGTTAYDGSDEGNDGSLGAGDTAKMPKWSRVPVSAGDRNSLGGTALQFDGVNDYVNCGDDASLDITDAITIEAWIKPTEDKDCYAVARTDYSSVGGYSLYWGGFDDIVRLYYGSGVSVMSNAVFTDLNSWVHATIVVDSFGNVSFYRNGQSAGTTGPITLTIYSGNLRIGNRDGTIIANNAFPGSIDSVRIYNRALSAEEVRYHYNRGGPVASWGFNEGEGQTAYDESSNNNDGQLGATAGIEASDPTWVEGKYGGALSFDGGDYVNCGSAYDGVKTISFWVKASDITSHTDYPIDLNGTDYIQIINGEVTTNNISSPTYYVNAVSGEQTISDITNWHHVAVTTATGINASDLDIARLDPTGFFNGSIDSVRIYNRALSAEEVRREYNGGKGVWFR